MTSSAQAPPRAADQALSPKGSGIALTVIVSCQLMLIVDASIYDAFLAKLQDEGGYLVSPEEKVKIFRRFYRIEREGRPSGHGIGLSIDAEEFRKEF